MSATESSSVRPSAHRRSGSFTSLASSVAGSGGLNLPSQYAPSISSSPVPVGLNRIASYDSLGMNPISDLVDGSDKPNGLSAGYASPSLSPISPMRASVDESRRPAHGNTSVQPFKPPTSRDIAPVTLAPIKKIQRTQFASYLNSITHEYDTFEAHMRDGDDNDVEGSISDSVLSPSPSQLDLSRASPTPQISADSKALSSIPSVFFEQNFNLDNSRIFDLVSENSAIVRNEDTDSHKILANNTILQEKLSWYIDTVELHLISEIASASTSFFSTLGDLKTIKEQSVHCFEKIHELRKSLAVVDEKRALAGIESIKLRQRRQNVSVLLQSLEQMSLAMTKAGEAESFLESEETGKCLDTIDATEALIEGNADHEMVKEWTKFWGHKLLDLRPVHCLNDLRETLVTLRSTAGQNYVREFTNSLIQDLRKHIEDVPRKDTLARLSRSLDTRGQSQGPVNRAYMDVKPEFRQALKDNISGLSRSGNVLGAFSSYKDLVVREAKNLVRMFLPSRSETASISTSTTSKSLVDKSRALVTLLNDMAPDVAEEMICDTYASLSELYRRLQTHQKLLLDITSTVDNGQGTLPPIDLNDLLITVVDTSQKRMVKILNARKNRTAQLGLQEFFNFYSLNGMFLSECEAVSGLTGPELRASLSGQIKAFLTVYHRDQCSKLVSSMEKDLWKEIEIPREFQDLVDIIVQSAEKDPEQWTNRLRVVLDRDDGKEETDGDSAGKGKKMPHNVFVENSSYTIAQSAINAIKSVEGYLELAVILPHLSADIVRNLNVLIKTFNGTANDLILGTGAVRSAGLKHITAKHLALCHESLNAMNRLIPFMQSCIKRHAANSASIEIDRLTENSQELGEHMNRIQSKLINLMSDRITGHCNSIKRIDWSKEPAPEPCNKYMQDMVKEVGLLIKIVNNYLPKDIYLIIASKIFEIYKRKVLEEYLRIEFKSQNEKQRVLRDVEYFRDKLSHLEGAGNASQVVWENVNAMAAPEADNRDSSGEKEKTEKEEKADSSEPSTTEKSNGAASTVSTSVEPTNTGGSGHSSTNQANNTTSTDAGSESSGEVDTTENQPGEPKLNSETELESDGSKEDQSEPKESESKEPADEQPQGQEPDAEGNENENGSDQSKEPSDSKAPDSTQEPEQSQTTKE
uniref:ARAD1C33418p n=1 Tax=Blastobotrys adeninivorans TaxID=409370 RepID=A0A060T843_BLAAD